MPVLDPIAESRPALLLFGAGGHGRVVADAALRAQAWSAVVASDRDPLQCAGMLLPGVPLLAMAAAQGLEGQVRQQVHVAIGHNAARAKEAAFWGVNRLVSVIHPLACVSPFAVLEAGCFAAASAVVAPGAHVGLAGIVNHGAVVDHDVRLGGFCHVAPNATLGGGVTLGQRVLIGAGAVVLPGVCVGDDVVVGAGAVVRESLLEPGIYTGVPARKLK